LGYGHGRHMMDDGHHGGGHMWGSKRGFGRGYRGGHCW
jgi:hypothetical protein